MKIIIYAILITLCAPFIQAQEYEQREPLIMMEPDVYRSLVEWSKTKSAKYVKVGVHTGTGSDLSGKMIMLNCDMVVFGGDDVIHEDEMLIMIGSVQTYMNNRTIRKLEGHIIRRVFVSSINHDFNAHVNMLERAPAFDLSVEKSE